MMHVRGSKRTTPTAKELAVGALLSQGLSNAAIARIRGVSPKTVEAHVSSLYKLLGVKPRARAELAIKLITGGYV